VPFLFIFLLLLNLLPSFFPFLYLSFCSRVIYLSPGALIESVPNHIDRSCGLARIEKRSLSFL
jgi:hypothetical protein